MHKTGKNFFTDEELEWIEDTYGERYRDIGGRRKDEAQPDITMTEALRREIQAAFHKKFPWRNPQASDSLRTNPEMRKLTVKHGEWERIGEKAVNWLQKHRPTASGRAPPKKVERGKRSRASAEQGTSQSAAQRGAGKGKEKQADEPITDPLFALPEHVSWRASRTYNELLQALEASWAEVTPETLDRRQDDLAENLDIISNAISRSSGAEILMIAVWKDSNGVQAAEAVSQRANTFLDKSEGIEARNAFIEHILENVGRGLNNRGEAAPPTVLPNRDRSNHPQLPSDNGSEVDRKTALETYFQAKWNWQGGSGALPCDLLEDDTKEGTYAMIEQMRLPDGITSFVRPALMSKGSIDQWWEHLLKGDANELPEGQRFQFYQPQPGQYDRAYRTEAHSEARVAYPAESLYFSKLLTQAPPTSSPTPRSDELPTVPSGLLYRPLSDPQIQRLGGLAQYEAVASTMLEALVEFYDAGPHELSELAWNERRAECAHLPTEPPRPDSGLSHFHNVAGYVPVAFFDHDEGAHLQYSWAGCAAWVSPSRWLHHKSGTLEGGHYGVKWPVLFLCHLLQTALLIARTPDMLPYPDPNKRVTFQERELAQIRQAAKELTLELRRSTEILRQSLQERRLGQMRDLSVSSDEFTLEKTVVSGPPAPRSDWDRIGIKPSQRPASPSPAISSATGSSSGLKRPSEQSTSQAKRKRMEVEMPARKGPKPPSTEQEEEEAPSVPVPTTGVRTRAQASKYTQSVQFESEEDDSSDSDELEATPKGKGKRRG